MNLAIFLVTLTLGLVGNNWVFAQVHTQHICFEKFENEEGTKEFCRGRGKSSDTRLVMKNSDVRILFKCGAPYPTEWIFNEDRSPSDQSWILSHQTTRRTYDDFKDSESLDAYTAILSLAYRKGAKQPEKFTCQAVGNSSDNVGFHLSPVNPGTPDSRLRIDINRGSRQGPKPTDDSSKPCALTFEFLDHGGNQYWWGCRKTTESTVFAHAYEVTTKTCNTAMSCGNLLRDVKSQKPCVPTIRVVSKGPEQEFSWRKIPPNFAGVVECNHDGHRSALEYFFSAPSPKTGKRKLHFSWAEVTPSEMIWMKGVPNELYATETLKAKCYVPTYGFSVVPFVVVKLNDPPEVISKISSKNGNETLSTWVVNVETHLNKVGEYVVHCMAPIWNSTEWANISKTIHVISSTPPSFSKDFEILTLDEGETLMPINCSASGNPQPTITWTNLKPHVSVDSKNRLRFSKAAHESMAGDYTCVATNRLNQTATKTFQINITGNSSMTYWIVGLLVVVIVIILVGYLGWRNRTLKKELNNLTTEEVEEFHKGVKNAVKPISLIEGDDDEISPGNNASIASRPFDSKLEVDRGQIAFDSNALLGSGAFGVVTKGSVRIGSEQKEVAIKTVKKGVDVSYFKALLSELKIMAWIGNHDRIVNLLATWTANIQHMEALMCVELCHSSLLDYLNKNQDRYQHNPSVLELETTSYENSPGFSTEQLIKWSIQVAEGMDFLASRKVVHGDLAARNILLTFDFHAKISDFGLARQLVDYNYTKSEHCPLPWKWMALEALSQMKFSTKSDVWSFGVVLWEIFSLGEIPYPGTGWTMDFVEKLRNGLRMSCPLYANKTMYDLMLACWKEKPAARPSFKQLFQALQNGHEYQNTLL